jgi:EmrB/QacA subfamily drug resistance transporter
MTGPAATAAGSGHGALKHRHTGLALAIIGAAQLMVMLDLTIVNVALPSIQHTLGFTTTGLAWVINAYVVTFGGLLLLGGRSGDLFGRRRMFVIGVILFSLASLAGGLATSQAWLIAARAVQGAGAAIASPTALGLIAATFEDGPARHRAMAVYAAMSGAGGGLGLLAGGLLTEWVSWRWVLFVNVPIGALVALGALFVLDPGKGRPGRLDLPGAASVTAGAALLVYGLARAADFGWSNSVTVASLVGAGVLLIAFVLIEARSKQPLLPLRILANRNRSGGYAVMLLLGAAMLSLIFFMTQLFQDVLGYSPIVAGLAFLPMPIMVGTVSQVASRLVGRIGIRPLLIIGPLFVAGGLTWMSLVTAHSSYPAMLGPLVLVRAADAERGRRGAPGAVRSGVRPAQHQPADRRLARPGRAGRRRGHRHQAHADLGGQRRGGRRPGHPQLGGARERRPPCAGVRLRQRVPGWRGHRRGGVRRRPAHAAEPGGRRDCGVSRC